MTLDTLYQQYHAELWRYVASRVGPDRADDVTGDLWLRAVRAWPTYVECGESRAWLYAMARSACIDTIRRDARRPVERMSANLSAPDVLSEVDAVIDAGHLLARLPARQARALWVTAYGYRQREAASALGVTMGAVKALLHRGRAACQP